MVTIYSYINRDINSYLYCILIQRPFTYSYYSCDTQHPCTVVCDILFTVSHEAVLLADCSIREGFVNQCC